MRGPIGRALALVALAAALPLAAPLAGQDALPDEEELSTFVVAYVDLEEIRDDIEQRLAAASSQEETATVQQQANQRMQEALEEHEFTIERYTQITNILNADEPLRARFQELYEQELEERGVTPPGR